MDTNTFLKALLSDPHFQRAKELIESEQINRFSIEESLGSIIGQSIGVIVEGAAQDLVTAANDISKDLAYAMAVTDPAKREELITELYGQLSTIAEINRLRIVGAGNRALAAFITVAARGFLAGLASLAV